MESEKKHNWFSLNGDIRVQGEMTVVEFIDRLDALGFEFLGTARISSISDEDYEAETQHEK